MYGCMYNWLPLKIILCVYFNDMVVSGKCYLCFMNWLVFGVWLAAEFCM